jgi:hypothetical protein
LTISRTVLNPFSEECEPAQAAIPFEHPELAVVAKVSEQDMVDRLQRALDELKKVQNSRPVQVLEAPKSVEEQVELPAHSLRTPNLAIAGFERKPPAWALRGSTGGSRLEGVSAAYLLRLGFEWA